MREDWIEVELGEVCEINMGQSPPSSTYNSEKKGLPFFQGKAEFTDLYPVVKKWCTKPTRIANYGDILLSVRAPVGSTNIANQECAIGRGLAAISYPYSNKIIWFYLKAIEQQLDKQGTGTTFRAVSGSVVRKQNFPLAPLPIQRAIVSKIEALFSDLDNGIANFKKAQDQLKIYRQAVLKKAFEGELTKDWREKQTNLPTAEELLKQIKEERQNHYNQQIEVWKKAVKVWEKNKKIGSKPSKPKLLKELQHLTNNELRELPILPEKWKWIKFNELLLSIRGGTTLVPVDTPTQYPILRSSSVRYNKIDFKDVRYIKNDKNINNSDFVIPNDLLFTRLNGTVDFVGNCVKVKETAPKNLLYPDRLYCAKVCNQKYSDFASFYFLSPSVRRVITDKAKSTAGHKRISITDITEINYPLCSLTEQTQIVQEIESRLSVCDKMEQSINDSIEKAEALRQSILKKAFEGKLLSQAEIEQCKKEADYEPASELLKKIHAEKLAKEQGKNNPKTKKNKYNG